MSKYTFIVNVNNAIDVPHFRMHFHEYISRQKLTMYSIESLDEEKVAEKWANTELDPDDPDYIDPKYLNYQTGGYMKLGIPTIRQNMSKTDAAHKIWLPISEEQRGVNKNLEQNAGW